MTYDEFWDKYQPIKNTITPDSSYDGCMFETYGDDLKFVIEQKENNIWTIVDGEAIAEITSWFIDGSNTLHIFVDNTPYKSIANVMSKDKAEEIVMDLNFEFPNRYITTGFHFVNRNGYLITAIPWDNEDKDLEILDD